MRKLIPKVYSITFTISLILALFLITELDIRTAYHSELQSNSRKLEDVGSRSLTVQCFDTESKLKLLKYVEETDSIITSIEAENVEFDADLVLNTYEDGNNYVYPTVYPIGQLEEEYGLFTTTHSEMIEGNTIQILLSSDLKKTVKIGDEGLLKLSTNESKLELVVVVSGFVDMPNIHPIIYNDIITATGSLYNDDTIFVPNISDELYVNESLSLHVLYKNPPTEIETEELSEFGVVSYTLMEKAVTLYRYTKNQIEFFNYLMNLLYLIVCALCAFFITLMINRIDKVNFRGFVINQLYIVILVLTLSMTFYVTAYVTNMYSLSYPNLFSFNSILKVAAILEINFIIISFWRMIND